MNNTNMINQFSNKIKQSITAKLGTIVFLILLLLIPGSMIRGLISEREYMNEQAISEVSSRWANEQVINGPILTVPIKFYKPDDDEQLKTYIKNWHVLPRQLNIKGKVDPQRLKRGIYEIVVYESDMEIKGSFHMTEMPDYSNLMEVLWDKAFLTVGISDLRGIKDELKIKLNDKELPVQPGTQISMVHSGVTIPFPLTADQTEIDFSFLLAMQGSRNLSFTPIGSTTEVNITSTWPSPSFNGHFPPDFREVTETGFTANWKVLQLNRNYPQQWLGSTHEKEVRETTFGMDLLLPLDDYQKSMRSAKYSAMTISLTFLLFFLVEILNKKRIHPFQYALVGLALTLFYVLLISISEHANFNLAYGIATLAVSTMITLYSLSIFKAPKVTSLLCFLLLAVYGFVFVTLQATDFALLLGSAGLTVTLAATMYFTRNINWYQTQENSVETA